MTDLDIFQPSRAELAVPAERDIDSWLLVCEDVIKLANVIYDTPFVPDGLRGSGPAVAAAILAGREMGLGPMTSLQHIHVIKGKPGQSALLMRALIESKGHKWEDVDITDTRAVVRGCRRGESSWAEASFTADQAKRAGIDLGRYPQDKLYARATVRLARRKFADVIMGMPYSAEELEDGTDDERPATEAAPAPAAPAARTAQRRQAKPDRPTPAVPAAASAPTAAPAPAATAPSGDLPPLPDEDEDPRPPALATGGQVGIIARHFQRLGFTEDERDARLAVTATIANRDPIGSTKELTQPEALTVADTLSRCKDRDALGALLIRGDEPGSDG
jgi:hypothetical protein